MPQDAPDSSTRPSLLLRLRDPRDAESWQAFVDVYGPLVYRHCRGRGLQDADAAEVTQEVLIQVHQSIRTFEYRPEHGRFRDWLGTVTHNKVRRFLRKRAGDVQPAGATEAADACDRIESPVQDTTWAAEFNDHIFQVALTRSRPHFEEATWRAFELVWFENHPPADVALALGHKLHWVYVAKSRVLERLQQTVRELAEDCTLFAG
jgi:RNA polymerase sigma-70 factor (ECF subfamily)